MALESATYVDGLVTTNPVGATDPKSQGDDHLRLIKSVLKSTFPSATKAFYFPTNRSISGTASIVAADMNKIIRVDTTAGFFAVTLPTLAAGDAGWQCTFIKVGGTGPYVIAPASGTLASGGVAGLASTRRCVPFVPTIAMWDGFAWWLTRQPAPPVGTILDYWGQTLPQGYDWANGAAIDPGLYPDYIAVIGVAALPDMRGRVGAGQDDMGGVSADRLTGAGGLNGDAFGNAGGAETVTLIESQLPSHVHTGTTNSGGAHTHTIAVATQESGTGSVQDGSNAVGTVSTNSDGAHTHSFTTNATGAGAAHANLQPTMILNKIVVME